MNKEFKNISDEEINDGIFSIQNNGYAILKNVFNEREILNSIEFLEKYKIDNNKQSDLNENHKSFHGNNALVINNLHTKSLFFWDLISNKVIKKICNAILNKYSYESSEGYILVGSAIRSLYGKNPSQQLHIDSNLPGCNHILGLQFCIPLDSFNATNGATQIVKESASYKEYPPNDNKLNDELKNKLDLLVMEPRDLAIFNTCLWHSSSEKKSKGRRASIFLNFGRWFLKQSFDNANNIPNHIFQELSEEQKK